MTHPSVLRELAPIFGAVKRQIQDHLSTDVPYVAKVAEHILLSGGKHLRPTVFVLSARLCADRDVREVYFSSAFEYLHAATLLHDDVIDESETRRNQTAAHVQYGNQGVILVGDYLMAKSMALGAETGLISFIRVMADTVAAMAEGEVLQLLHTHNVNVTAEEYEQVIYRKTAALIESACYLGAVLADAPEQRARALKDFGRGVGLAFQMVDDCLDYEGEPSEFGKPVGQDLDEGKVTLPLILTLNRASDRDRKSLIELIRQPGRSADEFERVKELIRQYDGLEGAKARAQDMIAGAKAALDPLTDGDHKKHLLELADFIVARRH